MIYDKLVRDRIPEIMESKGKKFTVRYIEDGYEKRAYLKRKLVEEADEFLSNPSIEELADVQEVIFALASSLGYARSDLEAARESKKAQRGAFNENCILEEVL
tara:strand:+ start:960 stop:1268 length:309 start_codon:yes stop_codon:yes gene_type:complete